MARGHRPLSGCHAVVAAPFLLLLLCTLVPEQSSAQSPNGQVNGFINFAVTRLVVDENAGTSFTTVQLPLIRETGSAGMVLATVEVTNSTATEDFFSRNVVVSFSDGVTTASATLVLVNDMIPEGNETFIVQITSTRLGAEIGSQNTMELVVRANDEPYGQFQFDQSSLAVTVSEPLTNGTTVDLTIVRGPGVFGRVSIDFEVVGGPDLGLNDITPTQGQLVFLDQSSTQPLTIILTPDEVPEGNETFTLQLSNPRGGATLSTSASEAQLTILENDTPIRFSQLVTQISEDARSADITVTRGLLEDGSRVGNTDVTTTVQLSTSDGTATAGQDYTSQSLTLTFAPGSTSQTLSIPILNDSTPEGDETISVILSNPSSDAVLHIPSTATVVILVNDNAGGLVQFASPNPVVIGEDDGSVGRFTIQRTVGTFSSLIIEWEITSNVDGNLAVSDFQPVTGNVTIPDGQAEAVLEIQAFDDTIPEVAEGFMVRLVRVISGAGMLNDVGVRVAPLFVTDSDDVYGLVEWAENSRLEVTATIPRELRLSVVRSGGSVGTISIDYGIVYLPMGVTDPIQGDASVVTMATGSVQLQDGQVLREFNVTISEDAFLEQQANFYVYLNSTILVGGATELVNRFISPRIGPRSQVLVSVPITAANGYTSFSPESLQVMVEEPLIPSPVQLRVSRDGAYGEANITWSITLLDATLEDIGVTAGVVTIPHGFSSAIIDITILPDDLPEVDKSFSVRLLSIVPANQRIRTDLSTATVTILQNDNAEGIFFISNATHGPFIVQESSAEIIVITIEREGGALTNQLMQYEVPNGSQDLIGGFGFANFIANQRSFTVTIIINDDTIPEIDETFNFTISAVDGNEDILGSPTSVSITILANDDFAGVFLFAASSLSLFVDEPRSNDSLSSSIATFTIQRDAGTFTSVSVTWMVTSPDSGADIAPGVGTVTFGERQQLGMFEITALPDEIPEQNETFTVALMNITGDGRLASVSTEASLVIRQNDDPINFDGSFVEAAEGDIVLFTITRGGQTSDVAEVSFVVLYDTASASDVVVVAPPTGIVVLGRGVREGTISVSVAEDEVPEESETLRIQLTSTTGDAVIVSPSEATLLILPSDDPNGVFQFAPVSRMVTASEGTFVQLRVDRLRGRFGTVDLRWTIYQLNSSSGTRHPARISDLSPTSNLVNFAQGNASNTVEFTVMDDDLPEFEELFEVELSIEAVLGDSATGARLGNFSIAMIVVPENDNPYGLFQVAEGSRMVEVAEDVPTDQPELGSVTITVERTFGTVGDVQVTWEILPLVEPYPPFVDLLFFGNASQSVSPFASRNDTGTVALTFSAVMGSIVTIPSQYHPTGINSGFALSLWLQPSAGSSGVLVAKTMGGGSTRFYALALVADGGSFSIRLSYLPASQQAGFRSVEVSVLQNTLADGSWHSLIVSVNGGTAFFYVDGAPVSSRSLEESSIRDGVGELTVGGLPTGESYNGAMQDVRIYTDSLSESQIMALASDAASAALTPISGYLLFSAGETIQSITTTSKDDSVPEPSQFFTVQLGNADGGARIDPGEDTSILTVLKSDAGNGIFGFDPLSLSNVITEPGNVSLVVNREVGMFETVFVSWEVREVVGGTVGGLATQDFNPASGRLVFVEGVAQLVLSLSALDELDPELDEDFVVLLTLATANDSQTSSTPTSGASIDSSLAASNITVLENDDPFGLIQFVTSPPSPGEQILPAISMPEISVEESDGPITVYVVRAQGNLGTVRAEYLTLDGTARSAGVAPDYVSSVGTLMFGPSDVVQTLSLTLLDDSTPELGKEFFVNLTNPSGNIGTPRLGIGSTLAVSIQPSDDAYGRFGFRTDSLARVVEEQVGGTPVTLTVARDRGTFGSVSVYWEVDGPLGDISPSSGVVEFAEDQVEGELTVTVADDMDPELFEVFNIRLVNASGGGVLSTTGNAVSTVTVRANDHPYGRFVFSRAFRSLEVGEGVGNVEVTVTREFGTVGMVRVEFATIASDTLLTSSALVGIDVAQLVQDSNVATTDTDYLSTDGTLEFGPGETSKSFTLTILEDTTPELREYVFVAITRIELNTSSVATVDPAVAPTLLVGNESLAFILISENDNARGVIQFTSPAINTTEPSQNFVFLTRTAGTFGEVSVQWEATPITADTRDYAPPGGTVTFLPEVNNTTLPLNITDDILPEFTESLTLRLVGVSGGARVGVVSSTVVNILANDDPNGALEFDPDSRTREVAEPNGNAPLMVPLTVRRLGGAVGAIQAVWNVTASDGSPAMADILPVSGTLQFVSNVVEQDIVLSILPDDVPEVAESFVIQLVSVNGGARIGDISMATVLIQPNDNPYGIVSFDSRTSVVTEGDNDTVAMVPVSRSRGTFGELRVTYTVQSADAASLATANGTTAVSYFSPPSPNVALNRSALLMEVEITMATDRLGECARACLSSQACQSFASNGVAFCQLYLTTRTANNAVTQMGVSYYEKNDNLVQPFYQAIATVGNDFTSAIGASIVIPEGSSQSAIPVTILGDTTPELNESLVVVLTSVDVVRGNGEGSALLGLIPETTVVIFENDDPHGEFYLVASDGTSNVCVTEPVGFDIGVTLTVERRGGTIGEVQVRSDVTGGIATGGLDFAGSGAVLTFADGVSRMSIAITILQDDIPERDEDLLVALSNPIGGATIAPGNGGSTLVIIEANDNAAGVVGLAPLSRSAVVGEGEVVLLSVQRTVSALGVVAVLWNISGPGNVNAEFVNVTGTEIFEEGNSLTEISIAVRADSTPEMASLYTLTLLSVLSISNDIGQATLDPQASQATITVRASDNPHGVVEFQAMSVFVRTEEASPLQLTIVRQFGTFGAIDVGYSAVAGNLTSLPPDTSLATPVEDFASQLETVRLGSGQQSTVITIPIVDDSVPELNEVFLVRLTSVTLVDPQNDTIPPSIGAQGEAEVTITLSDSPQGEFTFLRDLFTVEEGAGVLKVMVEREQGLAGEVSVVYFVTNEGATNGEDFVVDSLNELTFAMGQSQISINITVVDDIIPEDNERFCVRLSLPEGGANLGNITEMCVTIAENDDAFGVFSFNQSSLSTSLQETQGSPSSSSVAELRVERTAGTFRQVTVPFEVEPAGREDLSLGVGALVFQPTETFRILQVEAVMDTIPELNETYTITLLPPRNLGRLATSATMASITILANQDPYGVLEIFPSNNASSVTVEEHTQYVEFEIRRAFGTFGEVSVTMATTEGTAVAPAGNVVSFAATQLLDTVSAEKWLQFSRGSGQQYLVLASSSTSGGSVLYVWRGAFTPVQALSTVGARAFTFLSVANGQDLLVAANGGSPGNREVSSTVYQFTPAGQLEVFQSIPTMGASDVVAFQTTNGDWYLVIANSGDNMDNPIVDSLVLRWNGTAFQRSQNLPSIGASALKVFSITNQLYLAVTSLTDTRSQVFVWQNGQFRLDHTFSSQQAADVEFIDLQTVQYLAVASEMAGVSLLVWSPVTQQFVSNTTINATRPVRVEAIPGMMSSLVVTNNRSAGQIFGLEGTLSETQGLMLPASRHLYPFMLDGGLFIAAAVANTPGIVEQSIIEEQVRTDSSADFYSRNITLTFAPGQSSHQVAIEIRNDNTPEVNETFDLQLISPGGGARLGSQTSVPVTILTNDDAHGVVGFAMSSLSVIVQELEAFSTITLEVVRSGGVFGRVRVSWEITGEHTQGEVTPTSGEVVFADRVSTSTIVLLIQPDLVPELNEVTRVTLTAVLENGVAAGGDPARGARLAPTGQTTAVVTVQANDAPHGVVVWSPSVVMVTEEEGVDSVVQLTLIREFGSIGAIIISYGTDMASGLPTDQLAVSREDFLPATGSVAMGGGETSTSINITILHDNTPELMESFLVNITDVRLADEGDRQGSSSNSPRTVPGNESVVVQITENDNSRGRLSFAVTNVSVEENAGFVSIPLTRAGGTFGTVGVEFVTTGITATGGGVDYTPDSGSVLTQNGGLTLEINITNDVIPELEEVFQVTLVSGLGGAQIGSPMSANVTILRNDDINGVFSFADSSLLFLILEGQSASLTVQRTRNFVGVVTVYWEVASDGVLDLDPTRGNLTFDENVREQNFQVTAITDVISELFESFVVTLVSVDGGGRIVDPQEARIAIRSSDDPQGVVAFDSYPQGIIINEGDQLMVRMLRSGGLQGTVSVTWSILPADSSVFVTTSDTVVFTAGQTDTTITVQTLSDSIPEVARLFSFRITSTNFVRVDVNNSDVDIFVTASDSPHGVVQFAPPSQVDTQEDTTMLILPLQRSFGVIGPLRVNFSVTPNTAQTPEDFNISSQSVIIPRDTASGSITVEIINDNIPELQETFSILLQSVELAEDINGGRDFIFDRDPSLIDSLPSLGTNTRIEARILQNDNPFGTISITNTIFRVNEGETAAISLMRSGGMFGSVSVQYSIVDGRAIGGEDYDLALRSGLVVFATGQSAADILIPITDDSVPELQEDFTVQISLVVGSTATLGTITAASVIIEASDSPFGVIGFSQTGVRGIQVPNPTTEQGPDRRTLTVERSDGLIGATQITWSVTGPDPGREREDIDSNTLGGILTLQDGQSRGLIHITVLPSSGPEPEETFTITLITASNNVNIDPQLANATITVLQRGLPFGTIGFFGDALRIEVVEEELTTRSFSLPLARTGSSVGAVSVLFVVTRVGGSNPETDVTPSSGSVSFVSGQTQANVDLQILADSEPELNETFTVTLTQVVGGANLDPQATVSTFVIRYNDAPYGLFGLSSSLVSASISGDIITRTLNFNITRTMGSINSVVVQVTSTYETDPSGTYVTMVVSRTFAEGVTEAAVSLPITPGAYLAPDSSFTITIISASVTSSPEISADVSPTFGSTQAAVTEQVSNPQVGFDPTSVNATVNDTALDTNVDLIVTRQGLLGEIQVSWTAGLPDSPLASGSITPATGTLVLGPNDRSAVISLRATPRYPHGEPEVFAVQLSVDSLTPQFPAQVDSNLAVTYIEPQGVVQLGRDSYSGIEGREASVTVWRRYGSMGDILVRGSATVAPNNSIPANRIAATEIADFAITPPPTIIPDGTTVGTINISLPDNAMVSSLKVFRFTLTAVERMPLATATSPRLSSTNLSSLVTIIDDEGGAGRFQFSPTSPTALEGTSKPITITRAGGSAGRVTVVVRTSDGATAPATAGTDYLPVDRELTFEDRETLMSLTLTILDDTQPELTEYFTISLFNPLGGDAFIDPDAGTFQVAIMENDNPRGNFSLSPSSLTLSEDSSPSGTLTITRDEGRFESVQIDWEAVYTDGQNVLVTNSATVNFTAGQPSADIFLQLRQNGVPASGEQFVIRIRSSAAGISFGRTETAVTAIPRMSAVFQFGELSRWVVSTGEDVILEVQRVNGSQLTVTVSFSTWADRLVTVNNQLPFDPALAGTHFTATSGTLTFNPGENVMPIPINIITFDSTQPRAFYVNITVNAPHQVQFSQAVVVINSQGPLSSLYGAYFNTLTASSLQDLESVTTSLLELLRGTTSGPVSGTVRNQSDTIRYIVDEVVERVGSIRANLPTSRRKRYTTQLITNLLDIFEQVFGDITFSQRSRFVQSMHTFANSLLNTTDCPSSNSEIVMTYSRPLFYLEVLRLHPVNLIDRRFSSTEGNNFIRFSSQNIFPGVECLDVHYIEFFTERMFMEPTLNSKVQSISIGEQNFPPSAGPITYRVSASLGTLSDANVCLLWQNPTIEQQFGSWDSQTCTPVVPFIDILQVDYVECQCSRLGEFAVSGDVAIAYGWSLPAALSAALVMIVIVPVVLLHLFYRNRTQLATRILTALCVSIFLFELIILIDVFASDSSNTSTGGCAAMGGFLQFTALFQFLWILTLAIALWVNFMGFTDGREPLIIYVLVTCGTTILIVVSTILIGRFAVGLDLATQLYGRNGDFCFMPLLSVSLISTVLPIVIAVLATIALLSHSCVYWSRWEDFHNIYHDSFNRTEIPLLLVFFVLIFLTSVAGYLHIYLRQVYTFGAFIALNVIQGVYLLIVYFFVSCHTLTQKHKKYGIGDEVEPLTIPGEPDYLGSLSTLSSSRQQLVPEEELEREERAPSPPVVPLGVKRVPSETSLQQETGEDSHLDDLMFMLKTQTYSPTDDTFEMESTTKKPSGSEQLQYRRISIADTHL